jgi:hypothetical protein
MIQIVQKCCSRPTSQQSINSFELKEIWPKYIILNPYKIELYLVKIKE